MADFSVRPRASLPAAALRQARHHVIDCIGVALGGWADPCARIVSAHARRQGSVAESTVWGSVARMSAQNAALVNATLAHALDYDDTAYAMPGHPSVSVLPAALAMGEKVSASGADVLTAYIIGVEAECKLGMLTGQDSWDYGWHSTSTLGVVGATAAAGRLAGLDAKAMRNAFGIAASHACGLRQNFGTMTKPLHAGHAASAGVEAVELALSGLTASETALEDKFGYCEVFGGPRQRSDGAISMLLGNPYEFETDRVSIKAFPCCGSTHGSIGAALQVAHALDAAEIDSVMLEVPYTAPLILIHHRPTTSMQAKFSLEYCVATALLHGRVRLGQFNEQEINNPAVQSLLRRICYRVPDEWQKGAGQWNMANARIEVRLRDGSIRRGHNSVRKGDAIKDPLNQEELETKFLDCASIAIGEAASKRLLDVLREFDQLPGLDLLIQRLAVEPANVACRT